MKLDIHSILQKKYPAGEYALLREVRDAAGHSASRSADFISVALWPSRGCSMHGIELKSFRSDWLSELKKPEKAEAIFQYCDFFWLLTENITVAKLEEIPTTWGWMNIEKGKIKVMKEAPKLTPKAVTKTFLAALLKRAADKSNYILASSIQDNINSAVELAVTKKDRESRDLSENYQKLKKSVTEFATASGIDIDNYYRWRTTPTKIGEAVKFIEGCGTAKLQTELVALEKIAADVLSKISTALQVLNQIEVTEKPES